MGCDIHVYTEKLVEIDGKNKWVNCDNWQYNEYYNPRNQDGETKMHLNPIYSNRNYALFSVLAGVRDYSENNKMISKPKGLPKDISKITKAEAKRWEGDAHSHSYFTLKELKDFRLEKHKVKFCGLVSKQEAENLEAGISTPQSWCRAADPSLGLVYKEWEEDCDVLFHLVKALDEKMREEFWIFNSDEHPEYEVKIRIVFWFDN